MTQGVNNLVTQETQEIWVRSLDWEDPLEKEMAAHSSTLAWRIPWTEEPGGLSMGSPSVRHVMLYQNEALMRSCSLFSTTSIVDLNEKYV